MAANSSVTTKTTGWFKISCMAQWYCIGPKLTSPNPTTTCSAAKLSE